MAIKAETTEGTAVTPDVFIPFMSEDIVTDYGSSAAMPVSSNRMLNLRGVEKAIEAPTGSVNLLAEPKIMGYFLKGVYGSVTTGRIMKIESVVGTFQAGETITGGTSASTAVITAVSSENDYLLLAAHGGAGFSDGEEVTGGTSGATADVTSWDDTVYGHQFTAPQSSLPTYTVEFGFENEAYRYTGVRFNALNSIAQSDNIITASIGFVARYEFKHARVTAVTSAGAGAKTITVDQTTGLAASDTIKLFRPSTGAFLDFEAAADKVHTVDSITSETAFVVTDLETATAVGDIIVLAPQTASYTIDQEFTWVGGSLATVADDIDTAITASGSCIEDFEITLTNEIEGRHCADSSNFKDRFPGKHYLKGLTGSGSLTRVYEDMTFLNKLRNNLNTAVFVRHTGGQIGSTGINYELDWRTPLVQFEAFNANIAEDTLLEQEMPFTMFDSPTDGYVHKALLVNDVTSY